MQSELWSFIAVAAVVVVVPGADMALVTRNTLAGGRPMGLRTVIGTMLGLTVHAVAAVAGLSVLLATSAVVFEMVKIAGAIYLVWLGIDTIRSAPRSGPDSEPPRPSPSSRFAARDPLIQGVLTNVLNPKLALFFLSLLPQFVSAGAPAQFQIAVLSAIFVVMGAVWLATYVSLVHALSRFLSRRGVRRWLDRIVGATLVGLGVRLAFTSRH